MNELIEILKNKYPELNGLQISGYYLKKITTSSSISVTKSSKGYHIEITDTDGPMNLFPLVTSSKYLSSHETEDKRTYYLKLNSILSTKNLKELFGSLNERTAQKSLSLKNPKSYYEEIFGNLNSDDLLLKAYTYCTFNIRGSGQQQIEIGMSKDSRYFLCLRNLILPDEYLLILKFKHEFKYFFLGLENLDIITGLKEYFEEYNEYHQVNEETEIESNYILENVEENIERAHQLIIYGAPGTGKSYKVNQLVSGRENFVRKVTFHPEYDYASFIGSYRPSSDVSGTISYRFVPQIFTEVYINAWNDRGNQYYLIIEEINRGNCAEIFGDVFQLLDRDSGYEISPSVELLSHLSERLGENEGIANDKMKLPSNLNIIATMNTSDQSLFPMDSAFKRRWDWEYVPICTEEFYEGGNPNPSYKYYVKLDDKRSFSWIQFIKKINERIKNNPNLGMDKCMGNYFIKPAGDEISLQQFINKGIFYLWNDVFKDEDDGIFQGDTSYEDFFPINSNGLLQVVAILNTLDITIDSIQPNEVE